MASGDEPPDRRRIGLAPVRAAYLVHNLVDPAVARRLRMLTAFGGMVVPIGFRRDKTPVDAVDGIAAIDLGRTFDADFRQRIAMVLRQAVNLSDWGPRLRNCDVIIARNLEMLLLGALARRRFAPHASLVYEALDIHRFLLSESLAGKAMRRLERFLLRAVDLVIVSSPAFLREYFVPRHALEEPGGIETLVVENKLLPAAPHPTVSAAPGLPSDLGPPWRVGWFGMIRCRKSLDYLGSLAKQHPGLIRLMIRGRPSHTEFADFDGQIAQTPDLSFGGAYRPSELGALYGAVHFNWAIDFFEEGANSRWLLPNRIYEGGAFGAVPIAIEGTETARWLQRHGIGVVLPHLDAFETFLLQLGRERYAQLKAASAAVPQSAFMADESDNTRLIEALRRAQTRRAHKRSASFPRALGLRRPGRARDDAVI
jgi:succinoglycan biosynthesis protein ExoL